MVPTKSGPRLTSGHMANKRIYFASRGGEEQEGVEKKAPPTPPLKSVVEKKKKKTLRQSTISLTPSLCCYFTHTHSFIIDFISKNKSWFIPPIVVCVCVCGRGVMRYGARLGTLHSFHPPIFITTGLLFFLFFSVSFLFLFIYLSGGPEGGASVEDGTGGVSVSVNQLGRDFSCWIFMAHDLKKNYNKKKVRFDGWDGMGRGNGVSKGGEFFFLFT